VIQTVGGGIPVTGQNVGCGHRVLAKDVSAPARQPSRTFWVPGELLGLYCEGPDEIVDVLTVIQSNKQTRLTSIFL
jgi:hypothetical protein